MRIIKKLLGLNYFENFLDFVSNFNGCVSISAFASLTAGPVGIASSAVRLKLCAITAGIKKHKLIIKKKEKKTWQICVVKTLNTIEVFISKVLINSYVNHYEFVYVNNVLREYNKMKEEIKNPKNSVEYTIWKQCKPIVPVVRKKNCK